MISVRAVAALLLFSHHVTALLSLTLPSGFSLHPSASIVNLSGTERGVTICKSPIEPKETLLVIPLEHIIQPEQGRQTPAGMAVHRHCCAAAAEDSSSQLKELMTEKAYIALWLCHMVAEQRTDTPTAESKYFLDNLPALKHLTHIPMFWSEQDLVELQGSTLLLETRKNRRNWEALYRKIATCHAPFGDETPLDSFLWAQALTRSRTFSFRGEHFEGNDDADDDIPDRQQKRRLGMVPILDMLNHRSRSDPNTCDWKFDVDRNAFVVQVAETMHPGSEACISYGLYSNRYYLSSYGFTITPNCRHDGASPNEAHIKLDATTAATAQDYFTVTIGDTKAAKMLLSALRLSVATDGEKLSMMPTLLDSLGTAAASTQRLSYWDFPQSFRNEQAAMEKLQRSIGAAVQRYQTSLQDDLNLLERKKAERGDGDCSFHLPVGSNYRNSVVVRSGEKHVLQHWQSLCDASLCCLDDVKDGTTEWNNYCDLLQETCRRLKSIAP